MASTLPIRELGNKTVPSKPKIPCRFYAKGSCSKGNVCPFAHRDPTATSHATAPGPRHSSPDPGHGVPCHFFASGTCSKGSSCPFLHPDETDRIGVLPPGPASHGEGSSSDSRSQVLCQFFIKGGCRNGDACPFAHAGGEEAEIDEDQPSYDFQNDDSPDNWTRELGGAIVRFQDGATVSKISLPSDFSSVRLNNLPKDSGPIFVAKLLTDTTDMLVKKEDVVRVMILPDGRSCTADLKVKDPMFARNLCEKLKALSLRFEAVPIPTPIQGGASNLHRVDCKKIHCSWHRPTRTAWLNFGTEKVARKVQERINAGVYKVLGHFVKAGAPTGGAEGRAKGGWRRNPQPWTVMLTDLPGKTTKQDILKSVPEYNQPRHIELGDPSYGADADTANTIVKSMLLQYGPLEWWEVTGGLHGKRVKAQARFTDESHAREAVAALDNHSLSFSKTARLTVQLVTSAKFKVLTRIYDVVHDGIDSQKKAWQEMHIQFVAYPPAKGYRVLKLEGEDSKLVAKAKETLGQIVGGEVVTCNGLVLWHPGLAKNTGNELNKVKQVEHGNGVVILRDKRKCQLRIFGPAKNCTKATEALSAIIEELEQAHAGHVRDQVIELTPEQFQWACRGGFRMLTAALGDHKTTFDIVSSPKRITINGFGDGYSEALSIIASKKLATSPSGINPSREQETRDCSVCWTEAEDPITTSCDHVYCLGCFTDLSQAAGSSTTIEFSISCVGGEGLCNHVFTLAELQTHLSSATFEDLLESSLTSYIARRPDRLRYCPTPDCGQIYRSTATATSPATLFTCPKCLLPTCTSCNAPHPGQSCAEHKDAASGGYEALERIKKRLGIKDCPKCKTAMEKIDGCNHMTCRGCGTHICWMCMECFDTSGECYDHLSKAHGGCF